MYTHPEMCEANVKVVFYVRNSKEHMIPFCAPCKFFSEQAKISLIFSRPLGVRTCSKKIIVILLLSVILSVTQSVYFLAPSSFVISVCQQPSSWSFGHTVLTLIQQDISLVAENLV